MSRAAYVPRLNAKMVSKASPIGGGSAGGVPFPYATLGASNQTVSSMGDGVYRISAPANSESPLSSASLMIFPQDILPTAGVLYIDILDFNGIGALVQVIDFNAMSEFDMVAGTLHNEELTEPKTITKVITLNDVMPLTDTVVGPAFIAQAEAAGTPIPENAKNIGITIGNFTVDGSAPYVDFRMPFFDYQVY